MVCSIDIRCANCGHVFTLKLQMDQSIKLYEWPIVLVCPTCKDILSMRASEHKLTPSGYITKVKDGENITIIGYSSTLPVIKEMYYIDSPTSSTPFFSSFMNLYYVLGKERFAKHQDVVFGPIMDLISRRQILKEILPLAQKEGNSAYIIKKALKIFNKPGFIIDKKKDSLTIFNDFLEFVYQRLRTPEYANQRCIYYSEIENYISGANSDSLQSIISSSAAFQDVDDWLIKRAYPHIAEITAHIEQYIPAMFYSSIGSFAIPHADNWNILTIDYKQVIKDYADGFEVLAKILPFMVALHNMMRNGDCSYFNEEGQEHHNAMSNFNNTFGGQRKLEMERYHALREYFEYVCDNHIRNGVDHLNADYDPQTQIISFHYNANRPDAIHNERLIDVCLRVYLQTLIIMEIAKVIWQIEKQI